MAVWGGMGQNALTIKRILYWLEEHPTPTAEEICAALGNPLATPTVRSLLFKLKEDYRIVVTNGGRWMLSSAHRQAEVAVAAAREKGIDTDAFIC